MSGPATYRIRVRGELAPSAANSLCGLTIRSEQKANGATTTTLEGVLEDQAALAGVLSALYESRLPVISVQCLDPADPTWEKHDADRQS